MCLTTLLAATGGFLVGPEQLPGFVNVSDKVIAMTISDYYAQINGGSIMAYTLNLTGPLSVATGDLGDLYATNTTTGDLSALNTTTPKANIGTLRTTGNSSFQSPVTVDGHLTVNGKSYLGDVDVSSLTSTGQTNIWGILFAQKNLQVTNSVNVHGNTRVFGDLMFNSSLTVGGNLTIHDQAQILKDLVVQNQLHTLNLTVDGMGTLGGLQVPGWVNVSGSVRVSQDVNATNGNFGGSLSAHDIKLVENFNGNGDMTVNGLLTAVKLSSFTGNLNVNGNDNVQTWVSVDGSATFGKNLNVMGTLSVGVNVTSAATFTARDSMFHTLSANEGMIRNMSSTAVTTNNLVATNATIGKSFMSGATTLDTLVVKRSTNLTDVSANQIVGKTLNAGNATSTSLAVAGNGQFVSVSVKTLITAGNPSQTNFFGAFQTAFTDQLQGINLAVTSGNISAITGSNITYTTIQGAQLTLKNITSQSAGIGNVMMTNATVGSLSSNMAPITNVWAQTLDYSTLSAKNGTLQRVKATNTNTTWINATNASVGNLTSTSITTNQLIGANATVSNLSANMDWTDKLSSTTGTFTNLWTTNTTATDLKGMNVTSDTGTVSQLSSNSGVTMTFDAKQIASSWLWSKQANLTTLEAKSLRVTTAGWFKNVTLRGTLWVEGQTTLQNGSLSGTSVLASLDVVSDTELLAGFSSTATSFFTDLSVKRVTITDSFQANAASLGSSTLDLLTITNQTIINGFLNATKDSSLGGNLVVVGTTQFQTGSFTRIGTALITTTDMEAFNLNVAQGTFNSLTIGDFVASRAAVFDRSIGLAPLLGDVSGATNSLFMQIAPSSFTGIQGNHTFPVNTLASLHTGNASIDALVVTSSTDPSVAALRFKGDGSVDLLDGDILLNEFTLQGGVVFENEDNIAWPKSSATPNLVLTQGGQGVFYTYGQLQDRDLGAPGAAFNPTRFHAPNGTQDLVTLTAGHYRVSGMVYFAPVGSVSASLVAIATASVSGWIGSQSNLSQTPFWITSCVANFNLVPSSSWGGSCSFEDVLVVNKGETITLRTSASWPFSSMPSSQTVTVTPRSTVEVSEYFERTSEGLS